MNTPTPLKIVSILTGLVVAGEALALLIGMHFLSGGDNPWLSLKNDAFLVLDIITGAGLVAVVLVTRGPATPYILLALVGLGTLTHGYRDWEYLAGAPNLFCANLPLVIVNSLKIAGLLAIAALGLGTGINRQP